MSFQSNGYRACNVCGTEAKPGYNFCNICLGCMDEGARQERVRVVADLEQLLKMGSKRPNELHRIDWPSFVDAFTWYKRRLEAGEY